MITDEDKCQFLKGDLDIIDSFFEYSSLDTKYELYYWDTKVVRNFVDTRY